MSGADYENEWDNDAEYNCPISSAKIGGEECFLNSRPCSSSLSSTNGSGSICPSLCCTFPHRGESARSLIVTSNDGIERSLRTVPTYSMPKLEAGQHQSWLYSDKRVSGNHCGQQTATEKRKPRGQLVQAVRRRRECRQYDYLVLSSNSLVGCEQREDCFSASRTNHGHQRVDRHAAGEHSLGSMRPSASSPLGFRWVDKRGGNGRVVFNSLLSPSEPKTDEKNSVSGENALSSPLISREAVALATLIAPGYERAEGCHLLRRKSPGESVNGWTSWSSLPSSSNLPVCHVDGLTTAESLPALAPSVDQSCAGSDMGEVTGRCAGTLTALTPLDTNAVPVQRNGRCSLRCDSRLVDVEVTTRRHSGLAGRRMGATGSANQTPRKQRLSQPEQQKTSSCSLMMVSTSVVARSPSQQWQRNSSGNCIGTMPASTAAPPAQQQIDVPTVPTGDHRNALSPNPGGLHNPLYNVSNEFMRVAGYTQQFKRLLSKRNSYIRADSATDTFSTETREKDVERGHSATPIGTVINHHDFSEQAAMAAAAIAASGMVTNPGVKATRQAWDPNGDIKPIDPKRQSRKSAYGRLWKEQPNFKHRLKKRKHLFCRRTKISDFALLFALSGILLTILEAELTASGVVAKTDYVSLLLRALTVFTSVVLLCLVVCYHAIETKISVIDSGADDWRVAITNDRIRQCALEVIVCSVCPFPANVYVTWDRLKASDHRTPYPVVVPLDAVLSVPMFLRFYLLGRFMALHSRQFQDAATRSIAALNHIAVNFAFVLKTLMYEHPLRVLILFTVAFWVAMSWILTQCERYMSDSFEDERGENNHYLNSIWFIIITFMSIGYGDIVPNTYCGRALAITTGIVGAGVSSALIAVISRKLELSRAEKHVNQFMTDSKLLRQRKEAAAAVLQHTWFIHKYKNIPNAKDDMKLRMHQRRFLAAINEFRRVKWDQRKLAEQSNALVDVAKLQSEMHETLADMQQNQDLLVAQMGALMRKVQELQDVILAQYLPQQDQQLHSPQSTAKMVRQSSVNYPPSAAVTSQLRTPTVVAEHVDSFQGTRQNSCNEDSGGSVLL